MSLVRSSIHDAATQLSEDMLQAVDVNSGDASNFVSPEQSIKDEIVTTLAAKLGHLDLPEGDALLEDLVNMQPEHALDRIRLMCLSDNVEFDANDELQMQNLSSELADKQNEYVVTFRMRMAIEKQMHKEFAQLHKSWMKRTHEDNIKIYNVISTQSNAMIELLNYRMELCSNRINELSNDIEGLNALRYRIEAENAVVDLLRESVADAGYEMRAVNQAVAEDEIHFDDLNLLSTEANDDIGENPELELQVDEDDEEYNRYATDEFADEIESTHAEANEGDLYLEDVASDAATEVLDEEDALEYRSPSPVPSVGSDRRSPTPIKRHLTTGATETEDLGIARLFSRSPSPTLFAPKLPLVRADAATSAELEQAARRMSPLRG